MEPKLSSKLSSSKNRSKAAPALKETEFNFEKVNIEITNICNFKCTFCPTVQRPRAMMSVELFEKVVQAVKPYTRLVCLHLLGDPLVHPHLNEILGICNRAQVKVFFVTNGHLLRTPELLLDPCIAQVNFSLHSFLDNFPNADPSPYLNKIFEFTELALEKRPELYLNFRLWNLQDPGHALYQRNHQILTAIEKRFDWKFISTPDIRRKKSFRIRGRLSLHLDTEFIWPELANSPIQKVPSVPGTCKALSNHIGVLVDGTVVPCCLDHQGAIPLGNITHQSLEEILRGPRAQAMLAGFKSYKLTEQMCQSCDYATRFKKPVRS